MAKLLSASKTGTCAQDVYHAYQHSRDPATATLLHATLVLEREWRGSISIGVAVAVAARNDAMKAGEQLLKEADEGVYIAKRRGRNCVATTQPS
ncbi:MAG: hypothetical protein KJ614_05475 [Gammaproteobacteria bacterium]|uniref:hypothetical protein n=1 Tax=Rhodoferax sp. TaxID=50421 RepID=UPI0017E2F61C|nr:hypothetical protein [Rhodoferax sp.]MBU3898368.1 hypothetical protein [Gammaproteobacteria bacterium]MBA3059368.1 hypothetical protein [Rhodoferax sp.]MBU3998087.1 hypothetical protein [Gammaproteobacteria bacterium]MBU4019609.1 hypothetical protein [Gammaproteobacteria bacterium]MBU4079142.1 hypothetical protein [Gammaproteobacteria bacterium]